MGMIETQIEFKDLHRRNIVQFDRNAEWKPYLVVNMDRAYFYLNGNKIIVVSRDFRMCRDMAQVSRERNCWSREHRKKEYADQRKIYRVVPERIGEIDRDLYLNSTEVTETEFIKEYKKRRIWS